MIKFPISITDTAYPTGINKFSPTFYDMRYAVIACGDNIDAPHFILSGSLFYGNLCHESLQGIAYVRGIHSTFKDNNDSWSDTGIY